MLKTNRLNTQPEGKERGDEYSKMGINMLYDLLDLISMGLCPVGVDRGVHKFPPLVSDHGNGLGLPHALLAPFFDVIMLYSI